MNRVSRDHERQEITAPILVPEEVDYDGHIYSEEEVYKAARNYSEKCNRISLQHRLDLSPEHSKFVELYVTPSEMEFSNDLGEKITVKKGTWMGTMSIPNKTLWEETKAGNFKGFSIKALSRALKLEKAKVAGRKASEEGVKVEKRLFDIDFSSEDHHIALVDEAANATELLVVKAKHQPDHPVEKPDSPDIPESVNQDKENNMEVNEDLLKEKSEKIKELETELEALNKSKEEKEKIQEELEKAKANQESVKAELEELKKEKKEQELKELVVKAKEVKADDSDKFALILQKCKYSLEEGEFTELCKQLEKLSNIENNSEVFKDEAEGSTSEENLEKSRDKEFYNLRAKYISEGMRRDLASAKARKEIEEKTV